MPVLVQKHIFHTPKLDLDIGDKIPVTVGYETYGTLSPARDNAILICHHFTGTSHAAGRYHPDDESPGWWDGLIGPGKAFDTNRYFVIAVDTLCNLGVRHPLVITTGPATINPATGKLWGSTFPQVTMRDNVRLQQQLVRSMGIERLVAVAGPSTGGFQALEWAVTYPAMVGKVIAVASAHQAPPVFALAACQAGIDAIQADPAYAGGDYYGSPGPVQGLARATYLFDTLARSDAWMTGMFERKTAKGSMHPRADMAGRFSFQAEMATLAEDRAAECDPNHFIYMARAAILQDIGYGNRGLEVAAQMIKASVLMLPVVSDLIFPPETSQALVDAINLHGGRADLVVIDSPNGHMAAVHECGRLAEPISRFLGRDQIH